MQALVVSDPTLATEVLQMPKIMDKNRQALSTLDLVRLLLLLLLMLLLFLLLLLMLLLQLLRLLLLLLLPLLLFLMLLLLTLECVHSVLETPVFCMTDDQPSW